MTKKRAFWPRLYFFFPVLFLGLVSCGSTPVQDSPSPSGPAPTVTVPIALPITISLAGNLSRQRLAALDELIAQYESLYTNVKVEVVRAPKDEKLRHDWLRDRLEEGDTSLDILLLDATWPAEFAADSYLVSLEEQAESIAIEPSAFVPGTIEANELQGLLVAIPWVADAGLLYYRRDLLDAYGYGPPSTWSDLQRMALEIGDGEGLSAGYVWQGAADEDLTCNTLEQIWSRGGMALDAEGRTAFDSPQTQAAFEQMLGLVDSGASPPDIADTTADSSLTTFRDGEAVFLRHGSSAWEYVNSADSPVMGQVGISTLPASCLGGQSLALSSHSLHPVQALQFMAFLTGYEQQAHMAQEANQPPVLASAYEDEVLLAGAPRLRALGAAFPKAMPRPPLASYAQYSEVIYTEVNSMLAGHQDIEATAVNIQEGIEDALP